MRRITLAFAAGAALLASPGRADDVITIRLSYKVILNPADGARPPGVTDAGIDQAVTAMNALLASYSRGYRVQRVGAITDVGGLNDTTGPSKYYMTNIQSDGAAKDQMEADAKSDGRYAWDNAAINLYIMAGFGGGISSRPGHDIIGIGANSSASGGVQLHEIGHYYNLNHTQGSNCACCDNTLPGACTSPGDDGIADTLPDLACWSRDQIAQNAFGGRTYAQLNDAEKAQVDFVFTNLMSYHGTVCSSGGSQTVLTEGQLDLWTEVGNNNRQGTMSGFTRVVDRFGNNGNNGNPSAPLQTVGAGVNAANPAGGSIVLVRPGSYNEVLTINKPVTLRATRFGGVAIGTSKAFARTSVNVELEAARLIAVPGVAPPVTEVYCMPEMTLDVPAAHTHD